MRPSKTHFEQIPVAVVKKIAKQVHEDVPENASAVTGISPRKLTPHRPASLGKNGKRV